MTMRCPLLQLFKRHSTIYDAPDVMRCADKMGAQVPGAKPAAAAKEPRSSCADAESERRVAATPVANAWGMRSAATRCAAVFLQIDEALECC